MANANITPPERKVPAEKSRSVPLKYRRQTLPQPIRFDQCELTLTDPEYNPSNHYRLWQFVDTDCSFTLAQDVFLSLLEIIAVPKNLIHAHPTGLHELSRKS